MISPRRLWISWVLLFVVALPAGAASALLGMPDPMPYLLGAILGLACWQIAGWIVRRWPTEREVFRSIPARRLAVLYAWYSSVGNLIVPEHERGPWEKLVAERERRLDMKTGDPFLWRTLESVVREVELFQRTTYRREFREAQEEVGGGQLDERWVRVGLMLALRGLTALWASRRLGFDVSVLDLVEIFEGESPMVEDVGLAALESETIH